MNEEQYYALCEACDRVLLASDSTIERIAIPWLHIIREHPIVLANYVDLFEPANGCAAFLHMLWRVISNKADWYRKIGRSLCIGKQPWYGSEQLPNKIDFLFVSHLLNESQAGNSDDFYYSNLPNDLITRGYSVVVALLNHSSRSAPSLVSKWKRSSVPRVILTKSLWFLEEVSLHRRLKKESLLLRKLSKKEGPGLFQRILDRASNEALSGGSITNLQIASQIAALVNKLQPKAIVITHEGHAWERIVFASARSVNSNVRCIAYQHSVLFRLQHSIRRNLAPKYNPDQILTSGAVSRAQLDNSPKLQGIPISILGSNRTFNGAVIKYEHQIHSSNEEPSDNPACLVIPESFASECNLLFEFSLACAQAFPDIQFIWRLHPLVTFKFLLAHNPKLRNLSKNIVLSQATIEEDTVRCRYALYRGTTAIVQAVVAGLRPLYLQLPNEMTIDPLFELKGWRTSVKTIEDFHRIIIQDRHGFLKDNESEFRLAKEYCNDLYKSLNPSVLESAIISKSKS